MSKRKVEKVSFRWAMSSAVSLASPASAGVDDLHRFEEVRDDDRRAQVVVHGLVAVLADSLDIDRRGVARRDFGQVVPTLEHALQSLFRGLQRLVAEVDGAAVVGLQDEEAYGHGRVGLLQQLVVAGEELVEGDEVAQRLAHLLPVDGNHVVVHPVVHRFVTLCGYRLGNLALVVGEEQVHAAAVDVELLAQILGAHGRALEVPAGEAVAPGRRPAHDVLGGCLFPEGEVEAVVLLALPVELAGSVEQVVDVAARQLP